MSLLVRSWSKFSLDEMLPAVEKHLKHQPWYRLLRYFGITAILAAFASGFFGRRVFFAMLPFGLLGIMLLKLDWFTKRTFRSQFKKLPYIDSAISWTFTDDAFSSEGEGFQASLDWTKVHKLVDTTDGFLIYPQALLYYWVPFRGFADPSDIEAVRQVAMSKVKTYKRVRF